MNKFLFALCALISINVFAHNHHGLSREVLIQMVIDQEKKIEKQEATIKKKDTIIAKENEIIVCLEEEIHHLKHKLHKEHRYHALVKALQELLNF